MYHNSINSFLERNTAVPLHKTNARNTRPLKTVWIEITHVILEQTIDANLDGRKFFDFGFGNATGYYDVIDRPILDHPLDGETSEGVFRWFKFGIYLPLVLSYTLLWV